MVQRISVLCDVIYTGMILCYVMRSAMRGAIQRGVACCRHVVQRCVMSCIVCDSTRYVYDALYCDMMCCSVSWCIIISFVTGVMCCFAV